MHDHGRRQRIVSVLVLLGLVAGALGGLQPASPAAAQSGDEVWAAPVNLSRSGSASQPIIAAEADGRLHALWFDRFDGMKYSFFLPESGWSTPTNARGIAGGAPRAGNPVAPSGLQFFIDANRDMHVFYRSDEDNLLYSRKRAGPVGDWSTSVQLATAPLAWDVNIDPLGRLHLAVIRPTQSGTLPAGIYYRQSANGGLAWSNSVLVDESLYFRTMSAAAAHVAVTSDGLGNVIVAWDDPQLTSSHYALLAASGLTFGEPVMMESGDETDGALVRRMRLTALPAGGYLSTWESSVGCALFQQTTDTSLQDWSAPLRVFGGLATCPTGRRNFGTPAGELLSILELPSGLQTFSIWDGLAWSEPFAPQITFVNPLTNRPTNLGCLHLTLSGNELAAIGCDGDGDVWVSTSEVGLDALAPALESAWSPPALLSQGTGNAGLPVATIDSDGRLHVLWSETAPNGNAPTSLTYGRSDGGAWSVAPGLLVSPAGKAEMPSLAADLGGRLHAVWSGDVGGSIFYSRAFVRDATASSGWSTPRALPAPRPVGAWPNVAVDESGVLHVVYAIPLNENRGLYYVQSPDLGETWSEPVVIFDAVQAGWAMVDETKMLRDPAGVLHVVFMRSTLPDLGQPLGLYYTRSQDDGVTWSAPTTVATGQVSNARLVASSETQIHRTWMQPSLNRIEMWQQTSPDGGANWTEGRRALDATSGHSADIGLVSDGQGALLLTGIERTTENSAVLFLDHWNGEIWGDRERVALGYNPTDQAGTTSVLHSDGILGTLFRVLAPTAGGPARYVIGYTERPVDIRPAAALPTFTPPAPNTPVPTQTPEPTIEPTAALDLNTPTGPAASDDLWLRIGGIMAAMLLVSVLAVARLLQGRR